MTEKCIASLYLSRLTRPVLEKYAEVIALLKVSELHGYPEIAIQCHDNPDADSIASGYALHEYFKSRGQASRMIYGGRFQISKPNLTEFIQALAIPLEFVENFQTEGLLLTVDCQYGAGNVKKFPAAEVAIIDHHQQEIKDVARCEIKSYLGSCATVVWQLLNNEGFDVNDHPNLATALYYGLFTDTNNFAEIYHPLDKDMRDSLQFDNNLIRKLKNSNLTLSDIEVAGVALLRHSHNVSNNFAVFKAHPCDPNILGFISDIALQVNSVDTCVVYNETGDGIKFSVRSCIREVMASEMAAFITEGIGSGGGHMEKAGGFISGAKLSARYPGVNTDAYLLNRIREYYDSFDIIYSSSHELDISAMARYKKKHIPVGYVLSTLVFEEGTPLLIRTLEGDVDTFASRDIYFMIGIKGEVYPMKREKFERSYRPIAEAFTFEAEYYPSVRNRITGEATSLVDHMSACVATGDVYIWARPLTKNAKVFTSWDPSKYMAGKTEDFIAVRQDDIHDVYIIEKNIFFLTYEGLNGSE